MKKLTRILALLLALVLVFALLGGCGVKKEGTAKEPAPSSEEPTQAPEETPDEEPDEGKVSDLPLVDELTELTLWATINPNALRVIDSYSDNSAIKAAVELTNVYLKCTSVAGNLAMEQYPIMISTGDYTDMMNSTSQLYPGGCDTAVDDGVMIDLSPYLEEFAPDYWNLVKDKEEYVKTFTTDKGRIVEFVPVVMDGYVDAGYILRQDWLDAAGLEVPTTYDELYEVLTAWKNELGKPNALYINNLGVGNQNSLTDGFGLATVYDPMQNFYPYYVVDGQVKYAYEQDEFKDYLKMMNKWYKEDLVWKDFPIQHSYGFYPERSGPHRFAERQAWRRIRQDG
jgi:putative aldouronate transport system substrate-binding protein